MLQISWMKMLHSICVSGHCVKSHVCSALWHFCRCFNPLSHQGITGSYRPPGKEAAPEEAPFQAIFLRSLVALSKG